MMNPARENAMPRLTTTLLCLPLLAACGGGTMSDGSVRLGDKGRMLPGGSDAGGCPTYRMSSNGRAPLRLPFYRTANGDFTTMRAEAACTP